MAWAHYAYEDPSQAGNFAVILSPCEVSIRALGLFQMNCSAPEAAAKQVGMAHLVPIALAPRRASGPITVLLVDDDDQVRGFFRSLLTENGLTVLEADNGLEALLTSIQHQGAIDLLITDVVMRRGFC